MHLQIPNGEVILPASHQLAHKKRYALNTGVFNDVADLISVKLGRYCAGREVWRKILAHRIKSVNQLPIFWCVAPGKLLEKPVNAMQWHMAVCKYPNRQLRLTIKSINSPQKIAYERHDKMAPKDRAGDMQ